MARVCAEANGAAQSRTMSATAHTDDSVSACSIRNGRQGAVLHRRCGTIPRMAEVRPFAEKDLSEVAELFARVHPDGEWSRFREMLFGNPWIDAAMPSWIARDAGRVAGFIGVVPRPMRHRGTAVNAAVLPQRMIEP